MTHTTVTYILLVGNSNDLMIGFGDSNTPMLRKRHELYDLGVESTNTLDDRLLGWNKHCFTWKASGQFRVRHRVVIKSKK